MEHVAVTGVGIVSPIGIGAREFWQSLLAGKCAVAPMRSSLPKLSGNRFWAAVPDDFLVPETLDSAVLRNTDRFTQYALVAAAEAMAGARLDPPSFRTGVIIGNMMGGFPLVAEAQTRLLESDGRSTSPKLMALVIPNMPSALIAMRWKLHGPQLAISTACASSLDAIGLAAGMIERGEIDAAIAGGSETLLSPLVYESLVRAGALSRNSDPTLASRPFDVNRDGFVMGDGAAVVVLERLERAEQRGANILARIRGYGSLADAHHITSPDPSGRFAAQTMRDAIDRAGEAGEGCDVVYAHATGTTVGDAAEANAIDEAYANRRPVVTSIKGHVGHGMASAGVMCVVAGIAGMHESQIPPTIGTKRVDSAIHFDLVIERPRSHSYSAFQVNAFGFGGQNASLLVSR